MRKILYLFFALILVSCSKNETIVDTTNTTIQSQKTERSNQPDLVYHYNGQAFPVYYNNNDKSALREDENKRALDKIFAEGKGIVSFIFSNQPDNYNFLFDSEYEAYDYLEKNGEPLIGRKFKLAHRIDELREYLTIKYGNDIDYNSSPIYQDALDRIKDIYEELKIAEELPRSLEDFIGVRESNQTNQRNHYLLRVFEHDNMGGSELDIETATNTVTWTHGAWGCYRTTANPDLSQEFQPNGNNWDGCISSFCLKYVDGADAVCYGLYKDPLYAQYACSRHRLVIREGEEIEEFCVRSLNDRVWHFACGHMNDQISSIRIKVAWHGCSLDWSDL